MASDAPGRHGGTLPPAARQKEASAGAAVMDASAETALVVLAWFALNISIASSTKWIFLYGQICDVGGGACETFNFPLSITVIHMIFSWGMCWVQLKYFREKPKAALSIAQQAQKIAPLAMCFSLSVAMGNLSLKYIFPSFSQMLGAMSPVITVVLTVVMHRKRYNVWTWLSMPILCGGLVLCCVQEVNFDALGASCAFGATVLRAVKSIMQGRILHGEKLDSVTLLYYMAPWAAALLQVLAFMAEGTEPQLLLLRGLLGTKSRHFAGVDVDASGLGHAPVQPTAGGAALLLLLFGSGLNACLLNVANFKVTSCTSAVTLQVLGNVKNCVSIAVSVAIFRNPLTWKQGIGVAICLYGVWLYNQKGGPALPKRECPPDLQEQAGPNGLASELGASPKSSLGGQVELGGVPRRGAALAELAGAGGAAARASAQ